MAHFRIEAVQLEPQPAGSVSEAVPVKAEWTCTIVSPGHEHGAALDAMTRIGVKGVGSTVTTYLDEGDGPLLWEMWKVVRGGWIHLYTAAR